MSRDILGCYHCEEQGKGVLGILWLAAKNVAKYCAVYSAFPVTESYTHSYGGRATVIQGKPAVKLL